MVRCSLTHARVDSGVCSGDCKMVSKPRSRAMTGSADAALGIISQPGLAKTSFARAPGLVVLGSGGFWEAAP